MKVGVVGLGGLGLGLDCVHLGPLGCLANGRAQGQVMEDSLQGLAVRAFAFGPRMTLLGGALGGPLGGVVGGRAVGGGGWQGDALGARQGDCAVSHGRGSCRGGLPHVRALVLLLVPLGDFGSLASNLKWQVHTTDTEQCANQHQATKPPSRPSLTTTHTHPCPVCTRTSLATDSSAGGRVPPATAASSPLLVHANTHCPAKDAGPSTETTPPLAETDKTDPSPMGTGGGVQGAAAGTYTQGA